MNTATKQLIGLSLTSITVRETDYKKEVFFKTTCNRTFVMRRASSTPVMYFMGFLGKPVTEVTYEDTYSNWHNGEEWEDSLRQIYLIRTAECSIAIEWYVASGYEGLDVEFVELKPEQNPLRSQ